MAIPAEHVEYMKGLKGWLDSQEDTPLEEMGSFFGARISDYEEHMLEHWAFGYEYLAKLVPENAKHVLDLGC
ncbi:MAG: methyltransferase, partial [Clostridia bacterium]|nr:methyltransferase [Clostridia bacterium]